jgi:hypothetical protein
MSRLRESGAIPPHLHTPVSRYVLVRSKYQEQPYLYMLESDSKFHREKYTVLCGLRYKFV